MSAVRLGFRRIVVHPRPGGDLGHAKELNNPVPKEPVFFLKPETALLQQKRNFYIPEFSNDIHYELELVLKIQKLGKHINEKFAHTYYNEIGLGIDFTARDVQDQCKEKGLPWEKAKAFDHSAPLGKFVDKKTFENQANIHFWLEKNGEKVQDGYSADMIFNFNQIIAYVSKFITLKIGDLIFTGTPAGVGPVKIGDKLEGFLEGHKLIQCMVK